MCCCICIVFLNAPKEHFTGVFLTWLCNKYLLKTKGGELFPRMNPEFNNFLIFLCWLVLHSAGERVWGNISSLLLVILCWRTHSSRISNLTPSPVRQNELFMEKNNPPLLNLQPPSFFFFLFLFPFFSLWGLKVPTCWFQHNRRLQDLVHYVLFSLMCCNSLFIRQAFHPFSSQSEWVMNPTCQCMLSYLNLFNHVVTFLVLTLDFPSVLSFDILYI